MLLSGKAFPRYRNLRRRGFVYDTKLISERMKDINGVGSVSRGGDRSGDAESQSWFGGLPSPGGTAGIPVRCSVNAVVVAATDSTLTDEEHREVVCIGRSTTAHVMRLCRNAREAGADALLLVTAFISTRRLKGVWSSILPSKRSLSTCS